MVNTHLHFLKASGTDPSFSDVHTDTMRDVHVQNSLLHVWDSDLKRSVKSSNYFGIIVAKSTDLSNHKKLILYIRYVSGGE